MLAFAFFFFNDPATSEIYTLSLHDALPIWTIRWVGSRTARMIAPARSRQERSSSTRSEEHTSELQSRGHLVCRLLLEKKKKRTTQECDLPDQQPLLPLTPLIGCYTTLHQLH